MATARITETGLKGLKQDQEIRDTEVRGLFVRSRKAGKLFYYSYMSPVTGNRRNKSIGRHGDITVADARAAAKLMAADVAKGIDPAEEKRKAVQQHLKEKNSTLRAFMNSGYKEVTTAKTAKQSIRTIELHFPVWLDKPMSSITAWELEKWKRVYKGKPSGANRILTCLRGVLSKAVKAGLLDKSPMPDVKQLKEDKNKTVRYLSEEEEERLFKALDERQDKHRTARNKYILWCRERNKPAPEPLPGVYTDHLKPMVVLSMKTGLRLGEVFNLAVSDLDLPGRVLTVVGEESGDRTGAKSGQSRQIPINDEVFAMLTSWLNQTGNRELVFPSPKTGGRFHDDGVKTAWTTVRTAANLTNFRFHDLRHTFGTRLAHNRIDLVTIKELMGHESLDTTARYLHTSNELKIQAVAGI